MEGSNDEQRIPYKGREAGSPRHTGGMLGKIGVWRHVVALGAVGGTAVLAATGVIGSGTHDERFDSKVVSVQPHGTDGLRIREVVDEDFGSNLEAIVASHQRPRWD